MIRRKDRGKEFEKLFENATKGLAADGFQVDIQRLYDIIGKKTISQPADYMCYYYPNEIYVECKSTHEGSFSYLVQPQYPRLKEKARIRGVVAGMMIWYVRLKRVFWVDILFLEAFYAATGIKSISVNRLEEHIKKGTRGVFEIEQVTKRVNPEMNLRSFYNWIIKE